MGSLSSSSSSSSVATDAGPAAAQTDAQKVTRVDSLYSPHDVCEAAVDYVLRHVNTVQYMIQSIEEITGKPFLRDRIKCLPVVPRGEASCNPAIGLTPDRVFAGYMWRSARSDCQAKDVVLLEDHITRLFNTKHAAAFLRKEKGVNERAASSATTSDATAAAASSPSATTTPSQLQRLLAGSQLPVLEQVERNIRHELVHAFDDARGVIESSDCVHQACSEIRAARLSGDCFVGQEMRKGRFNFFEGGQKCVRRRAVMAVDRNPVCRGFSERAVDTVFQKCYSDYEPFAAPIYALGSYGDSQFANGTLKLIPRTRLAAFAGDPQPIIPQACTCYPYCNHGAANDLMSSLAVAASRARNRILASRDGSSKRQQLCNRTSNEPGHSSLHATVAAITSSPQSSAMPAATSDAASVHSRARQPSKKAPHHERNHAAAASSRSHKSMRTRSVARGRHGAASALPSARRHASSATARGGPVVSITALRHSTHASRSVRSISEEIALNRVQRAVRWFLMHRYLQRSVPVTPVSLSMSGNLSAEDVHADAALLLESRFLRRVRAEVDRKERAEQLRKGTAARLIQQALRRWAQTRQLQQRHLSIYSSVRPSYEFDPIRAAELDAALCCIQASLRMYASSRLVEARRVKLLQQTTASILDLACQTTLHCAVSIRHINDRQLREVLCRQEAVERRDLLRRHFVFLVCCHQTFFNDPRMWDAGVSIRRIPLYTHHGLLSGETLPVIWGTATSSSPLTSATADGAAVRGDAVASPLPPQSSPCSTTATVDRHIKGWGSPAQPGPRLLEAVGSGWLDGTEEDGSHFDIDAALRLGEYRFLFSPEEWHLLRELKASSLHPASPLFDSGADGRRVGYDTTGLLGAEAGALAAPPGQLQMVPTETAPKDACSLSYAKAFASALTFLRQPRIVDPSMRCTVQHLHDIRSSTLGMEQELRVHGFLFAAQVAPLLSLGFHYQGLARGDADLSCFTTTSAMKTCRPLVAGRVACAATELRRCLIGAVHDSGCAAESVLPVALGEQKCSLMAAARTPSQRPSPAGVSRSMLLLPRATPTAGLMRDGFANPATEALCHAPAKTAPCTGGADPTCGSSHTASWYGSAIGTALAAEWSRRLASSADEVGPYWCEFISSTGVDALVTAAGRKGGTSGGADAAYQTGPLLPSPLLPMRMRRGLESHLAPGGPSYLLQNFLPSPMRRHADSSAGPQPLAAATGSVFVAVARAGASPSTSVSTTTCRMVHPREWWDAVERLLLREYTNRTELLTNETVQRSSIDVLRSTTHPSADESVAEA